MAKKKNVKRTLAASLISMALCGAMLVGSTYAWFTDTASSGTNNIVAGNLDIELQYLKDPDTEDWQSAEDESLFQNLSDNSLLEPGVMYVSKDIKLVNKGSLALTYELKVAGSDSTTITYPESDDPEAEYITVNLTDVLRMKVVDATELEDYLNEHPMSEEATQQDRKDLWDHFADSEGYAIGNYTETGIILPSKATPAETDPEGAVIGETTPVAIILYWEPGDNEFDNKYNLPTDVYEELQLEIFDFGISVFATQTPYEYDSFGPDYDANAMAQHAVAEAVAQGLAGAQAAINNALDDQYPANAITVSPLTQDPDTGEYSTTFTFTEALLGDSGSVNINVLLAPFNAMADLVTEAVNEQKDNISELQIGLEGTPIPMTEDGVDVETLKQAFLDWFLSEGNTEPDEAAGEKLTCPVFVEDAGGTTVTYNFIFDLSALAQS